MVVAAVFALTACGGDSDDSADTGTTAGAIPVTVSVIPVVEAAAVYVADQQGFFAEEGLDVTITTANTSSAIIPGVVSGQYDIGFSNMVTFLLANKEGLGLTTIAPASSPNPEGTKDAAAIIATDPEITEWSDLAGKTVAVNALNNIAATSLNEALRKAGVDPKSVKLVELGFGEQSAALAAGQIDAGYTVEPLVTLAVEEGAHVVGYPYLEVDPDLTIAGYVMKDTELQSRPEIAQKFAAAVRRASELVSSDQEVLFEAVAGFSDIDAALLPKLVVTGFPTEVNRDSVRNWAELMVQDGLLEETPDVDRYFTDDA